MYVFGQQLKIHGNFEKLYKMYYYYAYHNSGLELKKYVITFANFSKQIRTKSIEAHFGKKYKNIQKILTSQKPKNIWGSTDFY